MTERGLLIVISGPSGVGKDTVLRHFFSVRTDCVVSISATTRAPRPGEQNGQDYFFISRGEFESRVAQGQMLEHAEYNGNYYGTPKDAVEQLLAQGKNVILEIEVQGALKVREKCPEAVFVFLGPPSWEVLCERLKGRGTETAEVIAARLETAKFEFQYANRYDYILINTTIEETSQKLDAVITAAASSTKNMKDYLQEVCTHA